MPVICSCGTQLVEDARFCHRCGKPTFDPPAPEPDSAPEPIADTDPSAPQDLQAAPSEDTSSISFGNMTAVRVGLFVAAIAVLILVPLAAATGLSLIGVLFLTLASGLLSVFLYQRRTGALLTPRQGARLGWITGVFIFALFLVLFTVSFIPALESGDFARLPDEALRGKLSPGDMEKLKEVLANPVLLSFSIVFFMAIYFVGATILTSLGGILGAKFLRRD